MTYISCNGLSTTYQCRLFPCQFLVITQWNTDNPKSHVLEGFEYADGRLHVPDDGRYYVYMQMYFNKRPHNNNNRVALFANSRGLLMTRICPPDRRTPVLLEEYFIWKEEKSCM